LEKEVNSQPESCIQPRGKIFMNRTRAMDAEKPRPLRGRRKQGGVKTDVSGASSPACDSPPTAKDCSANRAEFKKKKARWLGGRIDRGPLPRSERCFEGKGSNTRKRGSFEGREGSIRRTPHEL